MLSRYTIYRGRAAAGHKPPAGLRQDARKHTRHVLRPTTQMVDAYLKDPSEAAWRTFASDYRALLDKRFQAGRQAFDDLAELATSNDVFIGCSCPTHKQPNVERCHTWLALQFMAKKYPRLKVVFPDPDAC